MTDPAKLPDILDTSDPTAARIRTPSTVTDAFRDYIQRAAEEHDRETHPLYTLAIGREGRALAVTVDGRRYLPADIPGERAAIVAFLDSERGRFERAAEDDASKLNDDARERCRNKASALRTVAAYIARGDHLSGDPGSAAERIQDRADATAGAFFAHIGADPASGPDVTAVRAVEQPPAAADLIGDALRAVQEHFAGDDDPVHDELCDLVNRAAIAHEDARQDDR